MVIKKHLESVLLQLGVPTENFSSHSFRIGAATTAGLSQQQVQVLRQWSSDTFKSHIRSNRFQFKKGHPRQMLRELPPLSDHTFSVQPQEGLTRPMLWVLNSRWILREPSRSSNYAFLHPTADEAYPSNAESIELPLDAARALPAGLFKSRSPCHWPVGHTGPTS